MGLKDLLKLALKGFVAKKTTVAAVVAKGKKRALVDASGWIHDASLVMACSVFEDRQKDAVTACNRLFEKK